MSNSLRNQCKQTVFIFLIFLHFLSMFNSFFATLEFSQYSINWPEIIPWYSVTMTTELFAPARHWILRKLKPSQIIVGYWGNVKSPSRLTRDTSRTSNSFCCETFCLFDSQFNVETRAGRKLMATSWVFVSDTKEWGFSHQIEL